MNITHRWSRAKSGAIAVSLVCAIGTSHSVAAHDHQLVPRDQDFTSLERSNPGHRDVSGDAPEGGVPGVCGTSTLSQSTNSTVITAGNSVACNSAGVTSRNGYARSFAIPAGPNVVVNCVDFGVEFNTGPAYSVTVNIYTGVVTGPYGSLTLLGSLPVVIPANSGAAVYTADFRGSGLAVSVPGGSSMVVEIDAPSRLIGEGGDGGTLAIGSNALGQSAPSYIRAPGCGVPDFVTTSAVGAPGMHMVMRVDTGAMIWTAVTICNNSGMAAGGLVMSFSGAGGTVFVTPAMVVAPGCPPPSVPSNFLVTGTVDIDWAGACVPNGGSVTFFIRSARGPLAFVGGTWTDTGGAPIGLVRSGCLDLFGFDPFGGGPFWALKVRTRYVPVGGVVIYGPWTKPPGQCWQRWCCFPLGLCCLRRVDLCFFPNRFRRLIERPLFCVSVGGWRKWRIIPPIPGGGPWILQVQTWKPDPQDPQLPPGGPPPQKPVWAPLAMDDLVRQELEVRKSDDAGETWNPGSDFTQSFFDVFYQLQVETTNPALPPILGFPNLVMQMGPQYLAAAGALQPLINEMNAILPFEPNPPLPQMKIDVEILQLSLVGMGNQMNTGNPNNPGPFQQGAQSLFDLGNQFQSLVPVSPRFAFSNQHCQAMGDGLMEMATQIPTGFPTPIEQDAFLWGHWSRMMPRSEHLAEPGVPSLQVQLDLQDMNNWWPDAISSGAQVRLLDLNNDQEWLAQYQRITHNGLVDVPLMGVPHSDDTMDAEGPPVPVRVWVKAPSHLAGEFIGPLSDGMTVSMSVQAGDVNGDNCIDATDVALVQADQGLGGALAASVPPTDVNHNGMVNAADLLIVTANVGRCGAALFDCNGNSREDSYDIATGFSADLNSNGVPDECEAPLCPADIDGNNVVDIDDLLAVINGWGSCPPPCPPFCPADIDDDCDVDIDDLLTVINGWGPC